MADISRDLPFVLVHLDDILVISTSKEEHKHLDTVLKMKDHELIAKIEAYTPATWDEFLGYHISKSCNRPLKESIGYNQPWFIGT